MHIPPLTPQDALFIVDLQRDFCPGGSLPVPDGDQIIAVLNRWIAAARQGQATVVASRDWHPPGHVSFEEQGGPWPSHCVRESPGAEFHPDLELPADALLISKGTEPDRDTYSALADPAFVEELRRRGITRLWVGGLALDVCVRATVLDALRAGFEVHVLADGTRAVQPERAGPVLAELEAAGATIEKETTHA